MLPRRFARLSEILDRRQTTLTVLLDDLQKAHNVSAVMRTCDAVGIGNIHGLKASPQLLAQLRSTPDQGSTPTVPAWKAKHTSSAGSRRYVTTHLHGSVDAAVKTLRQGGFRLVAAHLDDQAIDFRSVDYTQPVCVVLGQEGPGVTPELLAACDDTIIIPMLGAVESLNVSVAAAVILFEAQRQRHAAGLYDQPQVDHDTRQRLLFEWGYRDLARFCRDKGYARPRIGDQGELLDEVPRG